MEHLPLFLSSLLQHLFSPSSNAIAADKLNVYTSSRQTDRIALTLPLKTPICLIRFQGRRDLSFLSYKYRQHYSSTFKLFSPSFGPNACINKFNLLYCFIPLALPVELSRNVINIGVIVGYYLFDTK